MELPSDPSASLDAAIASFQKILDYRFRNPALLAQALGAWNLPLSPEAAAARQRLEFLGDAAWDFAVAAAAFQAWPQATAGDLTRLRATWCSTTGLADLARQIGLPAPAGPSAPAPTERVLAEMLRSGPRRRGGGWRPRRRPGPGPSCDRARGGRRRPTAHGSQVRLADAGPGALRNIARLPPLGTTRTPPSPDFPCWSQDPWRGK